MVKEVTQIGLHREVATVGAFGVATFVGIGVVDDTLHELGVDETVIAAVVVG